MDAIGSLRVLSLVEVEEHTADSQQSRVAQHAYRPFRCIDIDFERAR